MLPLSAVVSLLWVGSILVILVLDFSRLDELRIKGNEWHRRALKHLAIGLIAPTPFASRFNPLFRLSS
jgi:hypothetical protein